MAEFTDDDGVREIQLNGKQLVFLFMAATVVSVVIFLCGVLVGRGVRSDRASSTEMASSGAAVDPAPPAPTPQASAPQAGSDPRRAEPPTPPAESVSYPNRLGESEEPAEVLKAPEKTGRGKAEAPEKMLPPPAEKPAAVVPPPAKPPAPVTPVAAATPDGEPPGPGYVVQVAALNVRSEADAIAKRLTSKGYGAYVLPSPSGTTQVFRVRIGKFGSRRDAETMATRLQKDEQFKFKPWVTR